MQILNISFSGEQVLVNGAVLAVSIEQAVELAEWLELGATPAEALGYVGISIPTDTLAANELPVAARLVELGFTVEGHAVFHGEQFLGRLSRSGSISSSIQSFVRARADLEGRAFQTADVEGLRPWTYEVLVRDDRARAAFWQGTNFPCADVILARVGGSGLDYTSQLGSISSLSELPQLVDGAREAVEQAVAEWLKGHRQAEAQRQRVLTNMAV